MSAQHVHQGQSALTYGANLYDASHAVILIHGRGATAHSMLELAHHMPAGGIAYLMPQAANNTWWPNSGFAPFEENEPYVSSAMRIVHDTLERVRAAGIPEDKIVLGGFSQGACLVAEFVARNARRYGGVLIFSGALMGPEDSPRNYKGSLHGTPAYICGAEQDPWVTETQLRQTATILEELGAKVTIEVQPGSEHTIRPEEISHAVKMIETLAY